MAYRLALDVGTASLGLVALTVDSQNQPTGVAHSAVHIFSEPLLPAKAGGVGEPKKAARRLVRQQRRLIERRARRLRRIAHLAPLIGVDPAKAPADDGQHIHALRASAIRERIELRQLLNVLLKLSKRRGYAGGFRTTSDDEDAGQVLSGIQNLERQLAEKGFRTLGELQAARFGDTEHAGRGPRESLKLKALGLYAHRSLVEQEFDLIWDEQARHHPILNGNAPGFSVRGQVETLPIRQHFKEAVFYQRPLKSVAAMVGQCALEPTLPRAPAAQPIAQAFRIEKQLADLRWGMGRSQRPLTVAQRDHIRAMLRDTAQLTKDGALTFGKIYTSLETVGLRQEFPSQFNTDRFSRQTLTGDKTAKAMRELGLHDEWSALNDATRMRVVNFIANLGSPEAADGRDWHLRMKPIPKPEVVEFIDAWVASGTFGRLGKMRLDTGRAAYSVKALSALVIRMQQEEGCDEHTAREAVYPPEAATGELSMRLPSPEETGNVVVDVALRVVRHAVNRCLQTMGEPPAQVIVELSRDMGLGVKARSEREVGIDKHRRARLNAKREIEANRPGPAASGNDIFRYLLAQEQDFHCPYCTARLQLSEALDGNATNVDHILPRSLTQVKRLRSHVVIAHRSCNAAKADSVPLVAFRGDEDRLRAVENCANILKKKRSFKKANYLLAESYEGEKLNDRSLEDFTERQFVESSWIAKLVAQWMRDVAPDVSVSRGELTAQLRRAWKLETVIPQVRLETRVDPKRDDPDNHLPLFDDDKPPKPISREEFDRFRPCWDNHHGPEVERTDRKIDKRIDHRHHIVDALVIGLTDRRLYMGMAKGYKERMEQRAAGVRGVKPWQTPEPPIRNVREVALNLVRNTKVRHKTDRYVTKSFFKDFAYSKHHLDSGESKLARSFFLHELTDQYFSLSKARDGIARIFSDATRAIVSAEFERRLDEGLDVQKALFDPVVDPRFGTLIKRVKVLFRDGGGLAKGENGFKVSFVSRSHEEPVEGEKYYLGDGYSFVALIKDGQGKVVDAVSVKPVNAQDFDMSRVAARLFISDTLVDPQGRRHLIHQIRSGGRIRTAPLTESRTWAQSGRAGGALDISKKDLLAMRREI